MGDAGIYKVAVDDGQKAVYWSDPFTVTVLAEGTLPLSAGAVALAGLGVLAAAFGIRKKWLCR